MSTATLAQAHFQGFGLVRSFAEVFSLALRYERLFDLSDAELEARGLTRDALAKGFIDEAGRL